MDLSDCFCLVYPSDLSSISCILCLELFLLILDKYKKFESE